MQARVTWITCVTSRVTSCMTSRVTSHVTSPMPSAPVPPCVVCPSASSSWVRVKGLRCGVGGLG